MSNAETNVMTLVSVEPCRMNNRFSQLLPTARAPRLNKPLRMRVAQVSA